MCVSQPQQNTAAMEDEMSVAYSHTKSFFGHVDMEMLHELLVEWCSDRQIDPQSAEGQSTAKELIDLFDIGVRGKAELREAIASK
jgi:hypothetical protein